MELVELFKAGKVAIDICHATTDQLYELSGLLNLRWKSGHPLYGLPRYTTTNIYISCYDHSPRYDGPDRITAVLDFEPYAKIGMKCYSVTEFLDKCKLLAVTENDIENILME